VASPVFLWLGAGALLLLFFVLGPAMLEDPAARAGTIDIDWAVAERNPTFRAFYDRTIAEFEAQHPNVRVRYRYVAKLTQRLPTMIASPARPHIIYSQGGGMLSRMYRGGVIRDITPEMQRDGWEAQFPPTALAGYRVDGRLIGVPQHVAMNDFYYNRALFEAAGVDAEQIRTWDDFLAAVRALKAIGVAPIAAGPLEAWSVGTYLNLFAMRTCGQEELRAAIERRTRGFVSPCFVRAAQMLADLAAIGAFQRGVAATDYAQSMGLFGDGRAAMVLSFSGTTVSDQRRNATDGRGLSPDDMSTFPMPAVAGAPGRRTDTYGGIAGWAVLRGAPDEAVAFLRFLTSPGKQREFASLNLQVPIDREAAAAVTDRLLRGSAIQFRDSTWHQVYVEDEIGAAVGKVMLTVAAGLVGGGLSAEEAAQRIQKVVDTE
jgi:raffinose/stachyose/melibiose transport system substrate-binding protein